MFYKLFHLKGLRHKVNLFLVNKVFAGANPKYFEKKRRLLNKIGYEIGEGTKIVGPIFCTGKFIVGKDCWLGKNLFINGNGTVKIGDNCDIAPEVTFQTGTHHIGDSNRRAGEGYNGKICIGSGTWIGVRSTILPDIEIGNSCIVAACSCVTKSFEKNQLIGGVPAKQIRGL